MEVKNFTTQMAHESNRQCGWVWSNDATYDFQCDMDFCLDIIFKH